MDKVDNFIDSPKVFKKIPKRIALYTILTYMLIVALFIFLINFIKVKDELELKSGRGMNNNEIVFCLKEKGINLDKYKVCSLKLVNIKKDETIIIPVESIHYSMTNNCIYFRNDTSSNSDVFHKLNSADKLFLVVSLSLWNILKYYYGI